MSLNNRYQQTQNLDHWLISELELAVEKRLFVNIVCSVNLYWKLYQRCSKNRTYEVFATTRSNIFGSDLPFHVTGFFL